MRGRHPSPSKSKSKSKSLSPSPSKSKSLSASPSASAPSCRSRRGGHTRHRRHRPTHLLVRTTRTRTRTTPRPTFHHVRTERPHAQHSTPACAIGCAKERAIKTCVRCAYACGRHAVGWQHPTGQRQQGIACARVRQGRRAAGHGAREAAGPRGQRQRRARAQELGVRHLQRCREHGENPPRTACMPAAASSLQSAPAYLPFAYLPHSRPVA